jgi:hypothetical protein
LDFVTKIPKLEGKHSIFIVVDKLTKYGHLLAMSSTTKAGQIADVLLMDIHKLYGWPEVIISNKDPKFANDF